MSGASRRMPLVVLALLGLGTLSNDASAAALGGLITSIGLLGVLTVLMTAKVWSTQAPAVLAYKAAGGLVLFTCAVLWIWRLSTPSARRGLILGLLKGPATRLPAGIDANVLMGELRSHFLRVQALWDNGDLQALKGLVLSDLLDELSAHLHGYVGSKRRSDVVVLNMNVLTYERHEDWELVCVEFTGVMRDGGVGAERPFGELRMLLRSGGSRGVWKLARQQTLL